MNKANLYKNLIFCFIFSLATLSLSFCKNKYQENVVAMLLDVNFPQFHGFLEQILEDIDSLVIPAHLSSS